MKFRVLAGRHRQNDKDGKPIKYDKNDIVETDVDLVNVFGPLKFERIVEVAVTPPAAASAILSKPKREKKADREKALAETSWLDVSENYPDAFSNDLLVKLNVKSKKFFVADKETPEKYHNDKGLTEKQVPGFIDSLFED